MEISDLRLTGVKITEASYKNQRLQEELIGNINQSIKTIESLFNYCGETYSSKSDKKDFYKIRSAYGMYAAKDVDEKGNEFFTPRVDAMDKELTRKYKDIYVALNILFNQMTTKQSDITEEKTRK